MQHIVLRTITVLAVVCLAVSACGGADAAPRPSSSPSAQEKAAFPFFVMLGDGQNQPGVLKALRGGWTQEGPSSFAIGSDGELLLLDQAKHQVLYYDPSRGSQPTRALALPSEIPATATALLVSGDRLYLRATLDPNRTTVTEWELDGATGTVLRTAERGPNSSALYPEPRYPAGEWHSAVFARDSHGYRYDVAYIPNCAGSSGHDCYEVRRFDGKAIIAATVSIEDLPPWNDLRDLYVANDGAAYELRWEWSADRTTLHRAEVLKLLDPVRTSAAEGDLYPVRLTGYVRDYAKMVAAGALPNNGLNGSALLEGAVVRLEPYGLQVRSGHDGAFVFPPVAVRATCRWVSVTATLLRYGTFTVRDIPLYAPDLGTHLELWMRANDWTETVGPPVPARDRGDEYCAR